MRFRTKKERSISSENTSFFFQHFLLAGFRKLSQFFLRCLIQILRYLNLDNCIFIPMDILIFHRYNAFAPQTDLTSGLCTRTDTADPTFPLNDRYNGLTTKNCMMVNGIVIFVIHIHAFPFKSGSVANRHLQQQITGFATVKSRISLAFQTHGFTGIDTCRDIDFQGRT